MRHLVRWTMLRGVPVADGQVERDGGSDDGEVKDEQRQSGQRERDGIVERVLVFQMFDPALLPAYLKAGGTEVFAVKLAIAERAEETAASIARHGRLFLRMVEATGFAFNHQRFAAASAGRRSEQGREDLDLHPLTANGAGGQVGPVEHALVEGASALGTRGQRQSHGEVYL